MSADPFAISKSTLKKGRNWLHQTHIDKLESLVAINNMRSTIYAQVDTALCGIRETSEIAQSFAAEHLKTPLGEPVKGKQNKTRTEMWIDKFYKKVTNLPEPFPHELVERLEQYLDRLEEQLVDLSSLLYDHRLEDAYQNSTDIFQSTVFTQQYGFLGSVQKPITNAKIVITVSLIIESVQVGLAQNVLILGLSISVSGIDQYYSKSVDQCNTRLYIGHLSSRTRSRDPEDLFGRYGRNSMITGMQMMQGITWMVENLMEAVLLWNLQYECTSNK